MKKIFIFLILCFGVFLFLKLSNQQEITKSESIIEDIKIPSDIKVYLYEGKIINSQSLILKKEYETTNNDLKSFMNSFDFKNNTYLLINCEKMLVTNVDTNILESEENNVVNIEITYQERTDDTTILLELFNTNITDFSHISINYEKL